MFQKLFVVIAITCLFSSGALAQSAALKSQSLLKAVDCLAKNAADGRRMGIEVDNDKDHPGEIFALHPVQKTVHSLLVNVMTCLDEAFPKKTILGLANRPDRTVTVWYDFIEGNYAFCYSSAKGTGLSDVNRLGGQGQQKDWFAFHFVCSVGEKIFGVHTP